MNIDRTGCHARTDPEPLAMIISHGGDMAQTRTAARKSRDKDTMRVVTTSCGRLGSWRNVHRHDGSI